MGKPTIDYSLVKYLKPISNALAGRTLTYDKNSPENSNLGYLIQTVCKYSSDQVYDYRDTKSNREDARRYWTRMLKKRWGVGQTPSGWFFPKLYKAGFSRYDVSHLINLSDPKIIKKAGLGKKKVPKYDITHEFKRVPVYHEFKKTREEYRTDWWGRLWGLKHTVNWTEQVQIDWEYKEVEVKTENGSEIIYDVDFVEPNNIHHVEKYINAWLLLCNGG